MKNKVILIVAGVTTLWMFSGIFKDKKPPESAKIEQSTAPKIMNSSSSIRTKYTAFNAISAAAKSFNIISQSSGEVKQIFVKEGDTVKAGDRILQIQNDHLVKKFQQADNALRAARINYQAIMKLNKRGLSSRLEIDQAEAQLSQAGSDFLRAKLDLDNTLITAPTDGIVDRIYPEIGDVVIGMGGTTIARFVNLKAIEVQTNISQKERLNININNDALITDDKGAVEKAKITFVSNSADPKTGTFLIKALAKNELNLVDGESVSLKIKTGEINSHNIPISAIVLDKDGDLSVKAMSDGDVVSSYKVDIADEDEKGVWVTGLPQNCKLLTAGQSYVK